jgi:NAD(P)-dependent dehydrogenase (short-subunit alcohol dehydrogenase family)
MKEGSSIINTTSVNAYKGHKSLIDYTSTKGAIVAFTRALSLQLADKGIRVNGVAPGPIWTPLIPSSFQEEKTVEFGSDVPMKRAGQPVEVAPSFVFLASNLCSSYMTGQVLHPNGDNIFIYMLLLCRLYYVILFYTLYGFSNIIYFSGGTVVNA